MSMRRRLDRLNALRLALLLITVAIVAPARGAEENPAARAKEILSAGACRGGLVVHVGCGDGRLTAALRAGGGFLVQGLDRESANVARAREQVRAAGVYGPVSVDGWASAPRLPYADNLVNLVVVAEGEKVAREELLRVLAPGGSACVSAGGTWTTLRKPRPTTLDDWTHCLHDASNNAVAADTVVGPPRRTQWIGRPRNARHHERLASVTVLVSTGGRMFYIVDEAPTASILLPPNWSLVARDAFNGVVLWKRPIPVWYSYLHPFRQGPPQLGRRLVAVGDRVWVTLGLGAPVALLDAATGKTLATYKGTEGADEILHEKGTLYVVTLGPAGPGPAKRDLIALDAAGGTVRWKRPAAGMIPCSLAVGGGRAYYVDDRGLVALDAATGKEAWRAARKVAVKRPGWSSPTVVVHDDVVLCADRQATLAGNMDESLGRPVAGWLAREGQPGDLIAHEAATGKELWRCRAAETYHAQIDVFVVDGLVWYGQSRSRTGPDFTLGRDLHTGKIVRRLKSDKAFQTTMPHHRCHRNRATSRYIVAGRTGVEFIDLASGEAFRHHWTRGTCQFGTLPCNGLLYAPPHSCACYIEAKLTGFLAMAPAPEGRGARVEGRVQRLEQGPARASIVNRQSAIVNPEDWPTHRHDAARSGCASTSVPTKLHTLWQARIGPASPGGSVVASRLTSPVAAGGLVLLASIDTHTVVALDADTGKERWRFTAGGRVDSPPSVARGLAVFGSADGCVYCVRLADGQLVWRFRAAASERRIVARGQVESAWPVPGSVLIRDDASAGAPQASVSFAAGRSSFLDGGMVLYRLALTDGKVLATRPRYSRDPKTGEQPDEPIMFEMAGAKSDVLSCDGTCVYLRRLAFEPDTLKPVKSRPHLYSPAGFLNGDWWHRTYWIYGDHFYSGYIGWFFAGHENAAGRLLSVADKRIYGYGYAPSSYKGATGREYNLFATDRATLPDPGPPDYRRANREYPHGGGGVFKVKFAWRKDTPAVARAMVLAKDTLFLAGPPAKAMRSLPAFEGKRGTMLLAAAAKDGGVLAQYELPALPVFDGLIAARGRLLVSLEDGTLLCLGAPPRGRSARPLPVWTAAAKAPAGPPKEPGLAGHWPLDEGAGMIAKDHSGLENEADVRGQWVTGEFGTCLYSKAATGALSIPDAPAVQFGRDSFSLALWLKPDAYDRRLLGKENFPQTWWVVNILRDGRAEMVLGTGKGELKSLRPSAKTPLPKDQWTHLAFVVDRTGGTVTCYLNGRPDSTTRIPPQLTGSLSVEGKDLLIPPSYKPFSGLFDEIRLYRRPLTAAEIQTRYDKEKPARAGVAYR